MSKNLTLTDAEQADLTKPLTEAETKRFTECEEIIERGQQTFFEVGRALLEIRDGRLYRGGVYLDFERYCRCRWQMGRNYANKLIASSKVVEVLTAKGTIVPKLESQVRPLMEFDIEDIPTVWDEVVKDLGTSNGQSILTARRIAGAIQRRKVAATAGPFYKRKLADRREKREQREQQEERMPRHASNGNGKPDRSERFNLDRALGEVREFLLNQQQFHWPPEHHRALADALREEADRIEPKE